MVDDKVLSDFLTKNTPDNGTVVYSQKTSSYAGQLEFLAKELLSGDGRQWSAEQADFVLSKDPLPLYRAFYPYEYLTDLFVNRLVQPLLEDAEGTVIPSFTVHLEEKALLALIWDKRWEQFLTRQLGGAVFQHLREVIPPI